MDPVGEKLLEIAKDELGYAEKGGGYTKYGDWYAQNIEDGDPYFATAPWCDMFLAWAADKAGVADQAGRFASTVEHAEWFKKHGAWGTAPEPGALVFFDWSGSGDIDRIDHVGLVEKVDGDTLHTIEANADGYKLMRKTRDMDTVVGFGFPGKVKAEKKYTPKHAAPPPSLGQLTDSPAAPRTETRKHDLFGLDQHLVAQDTVLGGILAFALCGTLALAAGRAVAAKAPSSSPVRFRKRGKHHRSAAPVALPPDITPADLDAADAGTVVMPALSAAAAQEAEDREFWGRIAHLREDEELAFWSSLHDEVSRADDYASARSFR